jgi:hypothetical protein
LSTLAPPALLSGGRFFLEMQVELQRSIRQAGGPTIVSADAIKVFDLIFFLFFDLI